MYIEMTEQEFETFPFRQDVDQYVNGKTYRSRGDNNGLYVYRGSDHNPNWDSYSVKLTERVKK